MPDDPIRPLKLKGPLVAIEPMVSRRRVTASIFENLNVVTGEISQRRDPLCLTHDQAQSIEEIINDARSKNMSFRDVLSEINALLTDTQKRRLAFGRWDSAVSA